MSWEQKELLRRNKKRLFLTGFYWSNKAFFFWKKTNLTLLFILFWKFWENLKLFLIPQSCLWKIEPHRQSLGSRRSSIKNVLKNCTKLTFIDKFAVWIAPNLLTHILPMLHFCTPWKRQKTFSFFMFSRGTEM